MKVLVIIPAYNEEKSIIGVVDNLTKSCPNADYIIINDCSKDNTEEICIKNNLNYLTLPVNLGIGGAVQTGYIYALENNYDIAIQLDGDGQHDPNEIEKLIGPIKSGKSDIVIGSRFINREGFQTSGMRRAGIIFLNKLLYMCCGQKITDATSGFRAASKDAIRLFSRNYALDYPEPEAIITASSNRLKICEVPTVMFEREQGKSSINPLKSIYYMIKVSLAIIIHATGRSRLDKEA